MLIFIDYLFCYIFKLSYIDSIKNITNTINNYNKV